MLYKCVFHKLYLISLITSCYHTIFHVAQQVIPAAQLVPKYHTIGRYNNYAVLQSIHYSPECKIVGQILLDHPLNYSLTATADVPAVDTLNLPVETPENPFVAPANIQTIEAFMNRVGYQGVVDKWDFMNNVFQKKEAIQDSRFIKLIIADLIKKFSNIAKRLEEDYHFIKDDIPLVSVYTTGNVLVRGMLIPNAFLTVEIRETDDFKEYETVFMNVDVLMNQPQPVVSTQGTHRLKPGSNKDNPEHVDDDDDKDDEKVEEEEGGEMGSLETRTEETQTTIPTPSRSPRTILSSDKNITQELTNTVPLPTTTTSQTSHSKRGISSKYSHFPKFNAQAPKIIEELFKNYVQSTVIEVHPTTTTSTKTTSSADLQQQLYFKMKRSLQDQANDPALDDDIHSHHDDHQEDDAPPEGEKRVKRHKALKRSKSARVIDKNEVIPKDETPELITKLQNVDKRVSTIYDYERMRATLNDALSNQFKNADKYAYHLEQTTNFMENQIVNPNEPPGYLYNKDLFFLKHGNTEEKKYVLLLHKIHAERFPEADLEEKMNRWVRNEFKTFNEEARWSIQHWKDSWHKMMYKQKQRRVKNNPEDYFSKHRITEVVRITTDQPHGLDFMEQILVMRENDKPDSFSEADFKYLNKNDIEDLYYLCRNKKVNYRETKLMNSLITFIRSCVIWERVYDFQLGIESYQIKVNLIALL
ncbi:hypothetical protein Tco_1320904 [Tanacetum coccineum]